MSDPLPVDATAADALVVLMTAPDTESAARMGRTLVEERLAACVNVVPGLRSIYLWQGAVQDEGEVLCLIKTRRSLYPALRDRVTALHPYQVPEILGLSPSEGNGAYLQWIFQSTDAPRTP